MNKVFLIIYPDELEILKENNLSSKISPLSDTDCFEADPEVERFLAENVWDD